MMKVVEALKLSRKAFIFVWRLSKSSIIMYFVSAVLSSSIITLPPLLVMRAITNYATTGNPIGMFGDNTMLMLVAVGLLYEIVNKLIWGLKDIYSYSFSAKASKKISDLIFNKTLRIKSDLLENDEVYKLFQRASGMGVDNISHFFMVIFKIVVNIISIFTVIGITISYHWYMPFIILTLCIPEYFINKRRYKLRREYEIYSQEIIMKTKNLFSFFFNRKNICEIKLFGAADYLNKKRDEFVDELMKLNINNSLKTIVLENLLTLITKFNYYFCYTIYAVDVLKKRILIGDFMLLTGNIRIIRDNVSAIIDIFASWNVNVQRLNDYERYMSLPEERTSGELVLKDEASLGYVIKALSYRYPNAKAQTLKNIFFEIRPGEKVCIVGMNGAGKTTLTKLIAGLYDAYDGEIMLNGYDIRDIASYELYGYISYARQDYIKYPFTARTNIILGDYANRHDAVRFNMAVTESQFDEIASGLKYGYDTYLNKEYDANGTDLSEGQWHKLLIAKTLFRDKKIVIFDEPTASLDPIAEKHFIDTILNTQENKTVIIISHRLSCARSVDRVFVMHGGQVIESGSHDELMKMEGKYYEMFNYQKSMYELV